MKRASIFLVAAAVCCAMVPAPATRAQGGADFTRFVGVGDSLTAGFKDGALWAEGQEAGFYALLAEAMQTQVVIPSIAEPGIPTPNPATNEGRLVQIPGQCRVGAFTLDTGVTTGRVNPTVPATDVAIPGQSMGEALTLRWAIDPANLAGTVDTAEDFVLGFPYVFLPPPANAPRTQIETAVGLQPTFVSLWLGSNDALGAAVAATVDDTTLTPTAAFNESADTVFGAIAATGAEAVVFNVPDVTVIPYLFSLQEVAAIAGITEAQVRLLTGAPKKSFLTIRGIATFQAIAGGQLPPGSVPANQIMTKKEIKKVRKAVKKYNQKIKSLADANGWALVDVNAVLGDIDKNDLVIPGVGTLTTAYLGGLFSLDGIHPSATGHAIVAAAAIDAINAKYGTSLVAPDVAAIAAADPQVCMAGSAKALTVEEIVHLLPAAAAAERVILGRAQGDR